MAEFNPDAYLAKKAEFNPDAYLASKGLDTAPDVSTGQAALVSGEKGALLGLRPVVAGLGAAAGDISGQQHPSLASAIEAFKQGRQEANQEEHAASDAHPNVSLASDVGGSLLTLPSIPAKGLLGALGLGAGLGAAHAAGSADSLKEAATDVGTSTALGGLGYGLAKGATAALNSDLVQGAGQKVKDVLGKIALKTPSELTGVPDKEIEAYATRADKVNGIIQDNLNADGKFDSQLAANHMKDNILNDVHRTRTALSGQIAEALNNAPKDEIFSVQPIKDALGESIQKLDPVYDAAQITKINNLIDTLDKKAGPKGLLNIQDLQKTKNYLYGVAEGAYRPSSEFFQVGSDVANAAKKAGRVTLETLNELGPPEIQNANRQLSQLHEIEDSMSGNILNTNASASSLYSVGAGTNPRDTLGLQNLGKMTGQNYLQGVTDLSAARTFANPSFFPSIKTGRSLIGPAVGASVGTVFGPGGTKVGAAIGTALSSPAALKLAIDTGRISSRALGVVAQSLGLNLSNTRALYEALQQPKWQEVLIKAITDENQAAAGQAPPDSASARRLINMGH